MYYIIDNQIYKYFFNLKSLQILKIIEYNL